VLFALSQFLPGRRNKKDKGVHMSLSLIKTKSALEEWDRVQPELARAADLIADEEGLRLWEARLEELWLKVSDAFYEETKDRNSVQNCRLVNPDDPWLRELVKKYGGG